MDLKQAQSKLKSVIKLPQTWEEVALAIHPDYHFNAISKCERDAYVDTQDKVEKIKLRLLMELGNPNEVVNSKFPYSYVYQVWIFHYLPWSASLTYTRLKLLFQSGIVTLWRLWKMRVETFGDTVTAAQFTKSGFKALSLLDSNVVVVFYVHAVALCFVVVVFMIESRKSVLFMGFSTLKQIFKVLQIFLRKIAFI